MWDAGHPSASASCTPAPDPFGSSQRWLCSRSSAGSAPSGPCSAAAAQCPGVLQPVQGCSGGVSLAVLPRIAAWPPAAGKTSGQGSQGRHAGCVRCGALMMQELTSPCPAPLPPFCSWPWAAAPAPSYPGLHSQPHGTPSLPPRLVPPLELACPSWHPCHLQALFLPWCWWQGPDHVWTGMNKTPPSRRGAAGHEMPAGSQGWQDRAAQGHTVMQIWHGPWLCVSIVSLCAPLRLQAPHSCPLGVSPVPVFLFPRAAWPYALEPLALRGAPCQARTAGSPVQAGCGSGRLPMLPGDRCRRCSVPTGISAAWLPSPPGQAAARPPTPCPQASRCLQHVSHSWEV